MRETAAYIASVARELLAQFRITGDDSYRQEALFYQGMLRAIGFTERFGKYGWDDPRSAYVRYPRRK